MNTKRSDISILRIIATLAVIFLHTNNTILNNLQNYSLSSTYKYKCIYYELGSADVFNYNRCFIVK